MMKLPQKFGWGTPFSLASALALVGLAWVISLMLANAAWAQPAGGAPQGPPPEALAACKALTSGAVCSFVGLRGAVTGTCAAPQGKDLACRPKDAPPPGGAASGPRR